MYNFSFVIPLIIYMQYDLDNTNNMNNLIKQAPIYV